MHQVVLFESFELHGVESDRLCELPRSTHAEGSTCLPVTRITSHEYFVLAKIGMVNGRQALLAYNKGFDTFKHVLVFKGPWGKITSRFFHC